MKKGHRRTESENILNLANTPQLKIKVGSLQNHKRMLSLIKASNRIKKEKTVLVQSLDLPKSKSQYGNLFKFGKRDGQQSTLANSPFSQYLLSIPERKPVSHSSLQKGLKKQSFKTPTRNLSKRKVKSKQQQNKQSSPYFLNMKKCNPSKKTGKNKQQKEKTKELFYKKSEEREKKKIKIHRK